LFGFLSFLCLFVFTTGCSELALGSKSIVRMQGAQTTLLDPTGANEHKTFTFDYSYDSFDTTSPDCCTNPRVYADLGTSVLENALAGYNTCLLAYGQTGSGKSYSMVGYGDDAGIVPMTMRQMFQHIEQNQDPNVKHLVEASMMEM
jgi:kinesin family protein 1